MAKRIPRVNQVLKREIGSIITDIDLTDCLVTITRVECSLNLQEAKVYVSVLAEEKSVEVFRVLNREIYDIQQKLNKRLKMRPVPKIIFRKEEKTKQAAKIEKLLDEIKKEESS